MDCWIEDENPHGVPRRGYVLSTVVEEIAIHVRGAVSALKRSQITDFVGALDALDDGGYSHERRAWLIMSAWLVGVASGQLSLRATLRDGVNWFFRPDLNPNPAEAWDRLEARIAPTLSSIGPSDGLSELLPYVLDAHGPGSRLSVRRDATTKVSRANKKAGGVFYTPPDVAAYMTRTAFQSFPMSEPPTVFDPAVGTGVFLRSALAELSVRFPKANKFELACKTLFGCDIDSLALDGAATVLLLDTMMNGLPKHLSPYMCWLSLRKNLVCADALLFDPTNDESLNCRRKVLSEAFPAAAHGFDVILGNPPYADFGVREDDIELANRFATLKDASATSDLYPAFIEQMVRLAANKAAGAMVLPLSIACNMGSQFVACRKFMQQTAGTWRYAFFDRQPHALFGEDVKTRNAILFWETVSGERGIATGPLRRWRGDSRREMLQSIDFTQVEANISAGIPKIHGPIQALLWSRVNQELFTCASLLRGWGRGTLEELSRGTRCDVFVAPTAYNFLGVARATVLSSRHSEVLSNNPYNVLVCANATEAACLYAILVSHYAFWWWFVTGDGFHVNQSTLHSLPLPKAILEPVIRKRLAALGDEIWREARKGRIRSLNRGRVSYAFPALQQRKLRREVDSLLMEAFGLQPSVVDELEAFSETVVEAKIFEKAHEKPKAHEKSKRGQGMALKVTPEMKEKSQITKDEWREYTKTVWSIANKGRDDHPAVFPIEIPHRLTKLFSFYGETVLDPFAGTGTTARAAIPLGRRAICVDQNPDYVEIIRNECGPLRNGHDASFAPLQAVNGDSRDLSFVADDSVGLIVTSPPYWDKANYGTGERNIGNVGGYGEFFAEIEPVFRECYRVLAPGRKLCVVTANVNQHTDHGLLTFPLATDFAVLLRNIGFVMINEIIWSKDGTGGKWGSFGAQRPIFGSYPYPPNFLFKNVHEYILIFAKPALTKTKGPKVKQYKDVMRGVDMTMPYAGIDNILPAYLGDKN